MNPSKPVTRGVSRRQLLTGAALAGAGLAAGQISGAAADRARRGSSMRSPSDPQTGVAGAPSSSYSMWYLQYANAPKFAVSGILYGAHNQGTYAIPFGYTIIKGGGVVALFDVGFRNDDGGGDLAKAFGVTDWESPTTVLAKVGMTPADVQHVIIGHAHFDHMGNLTAWPNAQFYLQQREMQEWVDALRLPAQFGWVTGAMNPQDILDAAQLATEGRLTLVDGVLQGVLPGVSIYPAHDTHTFGSQYISVATGQNGRFIVAGDSVYSFANLEGGQYGTPPGKYVPLGYAQGHQVVQLQKMDEMLSRVDGDTMRVIPGHDAAIFQRYPSKKIGLNMIAEIALAPGEPSRV